MVARKKIIFALALVGLIGPVTGLYATNFPSDALTTRQVRLAAGRAAHVLLFLPVRVLADLVVAYTASTHAKIMRANRQLIRSGYSGNVADAIQALDADADIDYAIAGYNALRWAVEYGHTLLVQTLIARGAQIPIHEAHHISPLCEAVTMGHIDVVQLLLKSKAGVNVPSLSDRHTPLWRAIRGENAEIARILVKARADSQAEVQEWAEMIDAQKASVEKNPWLARPDRRTIKNVQHVLKVIEQTKREMDKKDASACCSIS